MKQLDKLATFYERYDVFFCDVWGVLHNGVTAYPAAVAALEQARQAGKRVVLVTNSPRLQAGVAAQLQEFGITGACYDGIVTSGDVTRELIRQTSGHIFHIGPERDLVLYDGLDVCPVEEFEATAVVCTGLFDEENETPEDYEPLLQRLRSRNLPFICVNPDIVVQRGDKMLWCSGALARDYARMGGRTQFSGKPHAPIYKAALAWVEGLEGKPVARERVLAIGDGILTDIKGADQNGLDALFIGHGIHEMEYAVDGVADREKLDAFLKYYGLKPVAFMMELA